MKEEQVNKISKYATIKILTITNLAKCKLKERYTTGICETVTDEALCRLYSSTDDKTNKSHWVNNKQQSN